MIQLSSNLSSPPAPKISPTKLANSAHTPNGSPARLWAPKLAPTQFKKIWIFRGKLWRRDILPHSISRRPRRVLHVTSHLGPPWSPSPWCSRQLVSFLVCLPWQVLVSILPWTPLPSCMAASMLLCIDPISVSTYTPLVASMPSSLGIPHLLPWWCSLQQLG